MSIGPQSDKEIIEDLKFKLYKLESEEEKIQKELDRIGREKRAILDEMSRYSNADYEQSMLELVYEQRHRK